MLIGNTNAWPLGVISLLAGASCAQLLAEVSAGCFAAGVTGNSDYRACSGGVDTCQSGFVCDAQSGACKAEWRD